MRSSAGPCNPLTPAPTTLGTLLGVGKDSQSTLYVADIAPGTGSPDGQWPTPQTLTGMSFTCLGG